MRERTNRLVNFGGHRQHDCLKQRIYRISFIHVVKMPILMELAFFVLIRNGTPG